MSEVLSIDEACEFLKLAKPTLYGYVRKGEVPAFKLGRAWKFHKNSLNQWIQDNVQKETAQRSKVKQKAKAKA